MNDGNEIHYEPGGSPLAKRRWPQWAVIVAVVSLVAWWIARSTESMVGAFVLFAGIIIRDTFIGPKVDVDARGIRRRLGRNFTWSDIASVRRPGPSDRHVRLNLRDNSRVDIPLPREYAEQVARIGGKPLVDAP